MRKSSASGLCVEKIFEPSMRQPSPSFVALVLRSVTAEPASGSVIPSETILRPCSRSGRKRRFCSALAYSTNVRMGPKLPACTMSALRGQTSATSWMAMTASMSEPPMPPSSSGKVIPMRPCAAIFRAISQGYLLLCARLSMPEASSPCAKRRTDSWKARCSSVRSKFMVSSGARLWNNGPQPRSREESSMKLKRLLAVVAVAAILPAAAQEYPAKTVRIVVSFTAGGTTDVIARQIAGRLAHHWKQTVIVENKPGAGGTLGTDYVVSQPADGYTFLMSSSGPIAISPLLGKKLVTDPGSALEPVVLVADVANVLVTASDYKSRTIPDLVKDAKARPGALNYASTGVGTVAHLAGAAFADKAGIQTTHVPYKGAEAVTDVMAGRVDFMFATLPSVIGQIKGGKLVPIGQIAP